MRERFRGAREERSPPSPPFLLAAIVLRKPFARVPENAMKALVGVMLLALGTFWTGEGLHVAWPLGDATLFAIAGLYAAASALAVAVLRRVN